MEMAHHNPLLIKKHSSQPIIRGDDIKTEYNAFIPIINDPITNYTQPKIDDSTCTRFMRKKFFCIIVFLFSIITCCQLFDTFLTKISNDDFETISTVLSKSLKYIFYKLNSTRNE